METDRCQEEGPQIIWEKFMGQVDTKENQQEEKYKQEEKGTIDDYVSRLKLQALKTTISRKGSSNS